MSEESEERAVAEASVRVVRVGHGGNCSSVGSVIDTLFVSAAVGGAIVAAICAAMREERIVVVGESGHGHVRDESESESESDEGGGA